MTDFEDTENEDVEVKVPHIADSLLGVIAFFVERMHDRNSPGECLDLEEASKAKFGELVAPILGNRNPNTCEGGEADILLVVKKVINWTDKMASRELELFQNRHH